MIESTVNPRRWSGAEIIATYLAIDPSTVRSKVYESRRYHDPYVYKVNGDFYCCPNERQRLPHGEPRAETFEWTMAADVLGRSVFISKANIKPKAKAA